MKYAIILACIVSTHLLNAQIEVSKKGSFEVGSSYDIVEKELIPSSEEKIFEYQGDIIKYVRNGRYINLQRIDGKTLKEVKRSKITIQMPWEGMCVELGNKHYYLAQEYDGKAKETHVVVRELNLDNCSLENEKVIIVDKGRAQQYVWQVTDGKKYAVLRYGIKHDDGVDEDTENSDKQKVVVINEDFEVQWSQEFIMPYVRKRILAQKYILSNNGEHLDVVMRVIDDVSKPEVLGDKANYRFEVLTIEGGEEPKLNRLDDIPLDQYPFCIELKHGSDGNILMYGNYGRPNDKGEYYLSEGYYLANFNEGFDLKGIEFYPIPENLLHEYTSDESLAKQGLTNDKNRFAFFSFDVIELSTEMDGSHMVYLEPVRILNGDDATSYSYYDIYVFNIAKNGTVNWSKKLPVYNYSRSNVGTKGEGIKFHNGATCDYILFLDHADNLNLSPDQSAKMLNARDGGQLTIYSVYPNGEVLKSPIVDMTNVNGKLVSLFSVNRIAEMKDGEYVFEGYQRGVGGFMTKVKVQ